MRRRVFENIIGQRNVIDVLENGLRHGRIGHAYIFTGPEGAGKKTVAKEFARGILCTDEDVLSVCGTCKICRLIDNSTNPDLYVIDTKGQRIGIDEIRALQEHVIIKPLYSKWKVYLIYDGDKMTSQAQNALLKTFEEPPPYAVIIITAVSYEALKETIRSRAIRLTFTRNSNEEVKSYISQALEKTYTDIDFLTEYADGVIGRALELAQSEGLRAIRDKVLEIITSPRDEHLDYLEQNKDNISQILDILILYYRDFLFMLEQCPDRMLINSDKKDIIINNIGKFSVKRLIDLIKVVEDTRRKLEFNTNYQLTVEVLMMHIQEG